MCGLKQSPRTWFDKFTRVMIDMILKHAPEDHTLFIKHSEIRGVIDLLIYVDDIIITTNDKKEQLTLKQCLSKEFENNEVRKLKHFLGIEVVHYTYRIFIYQQKYIYDLLLAS